MNDFYGFYSPNCLALHMTCYRSNCHIALELDCLRVIEHLFKGAHTVNKSQKNLNLQLDIYWLIPIALGTKYLDIVHWVFKGDLYIPGLASWQFLPYEHSLLPAFLTSMGSLSLPQSAGDKWMAAWRAATNHWPSSHMRTHQKELGV